MDLLSQAKDFLARKASKLAMAAVPLAVLAVATPAKATTLTLDPTMNDKCTAYTGGTCTLSTNSTGGSPFLNQLVLTGSTASIGDYANLSNSGSGTASGTLPAGSVPVSWVFDVTGNTGELTWGVYFSLIYTSGSYVFSQNGSTSGGMVTGSGAITIPMSTAITAYYISVYAQGSSNFTLSAPLTINSASSAPEPGSLLLMGAGGAALLLLRRKKPAR